ncbi:MAG: hypothetical protein JW888_16600 [Pirellulales bacterium]|nr:hypothetical protein [Pirellulales bacterium]
MACGSRVFRSLVVYSVAVLCLAVLVSSTPAAPLRTWTDMSGRFQIHAKFMSLSDGKVKLEQDDGRRIEIPLAKLSKADQQYVAQLLAAANPFMTDKEKAALRAALSTAETSSGTKAATPVVTSRSHVETAQPSTRPTVRSTNSNKSQSGAASPVASMRRIAPVDWSTIKKLEMPPPMGQWSLSLAAPSESKETSVGRPVVIPPPAFGRERVTHIAIGAARDRAVVGYSGGDGESAWTRLVSCKLSKAGRGTLLKPIAGYYVPVGLRNDDNGKQFFVKGNASGKKECDVLGLWRTKGLTIVKEAEWSPYADVPAASPDKPVDAVAWKKIRWASLLAGNRAATMNEAGTLVVWDLEAGRPLYGLEANAGSVPDVSANQRYLAFGVGNGIGVLDLDAEEIVVRQDWPDVHFAWPAFHFSPSGKRLCCNLHGPRILVWDCTTGQLLRDLKSFSFNMITDVNWVDDEYLLLSLMGTHYLFNVVAELPVWAYEGAERAASVGDCVWFLGFPKPNAPGFFLPTRLPHPTAQQMFAKAKNDPKLFLLAPGTGVRLNLGAAGAESPKIEDILTKKLKERGFKIDPSSSIELVASVEAGTPREASIRMSFGREGSGDYTMTPMTTRLKLVHQGKTLWEDSTTASGLWGGMIMVGPNETVQDVINESTKPNWSFVEKVDLPTRILSPDIKGALGESNVAELAKRR